MTKVSGREKLFKGRYFEQEITGPVGVALAHTTMMRWVQRFVPAFEKHAWPDVPGVWMRPT